MAVALGMQARGHSVTTANNRLHRSRVASADLPWADLRPEAPDRPAPELMARAMDPVRRPRLGSETTVTPAVRNRVADLLAASPGKDLLVCKPLSLGAPSVAERLGPPWTSAVLQPRVGCAPPATP